MRGAELAAQLGRELRGEVRADAYTRHLFASDASLYSSAPLLVAFPRDAADVAAAVEAAARFDVPVVTRGAGTSLAGQTAGQGLVLDTSRHMDAIGEVDVAARRVRVGPGVVQEDLNRAAARYGLGFGPDTSTSNRATLGGMIGNNSSGSHSIVYGTTIDHVHELEVVLSDGSTARLGPVDELERVRRARAPTLEGAIYRGLPAILRDHARAIAEDYPRHWRQSGGYRLDRLARGFDLATLRDRLGGHARGDHRGDGRSDRAAAGEDVRRRALRLGRRRDRRDRGRARARGGRDRDDRRDDPRAVALQARVRADGRDDRGRARRAAVRDVLRRHARGGRRAARPPQAAWREHGHGYHFAARGVAGRAGRADQGPQGRPRPADGRQRGLAPPGRVRRGHRGRARAARRLRQGVPRDPRPPRPQGRLLRPLLGRLPAHPAVRRPHRAGRRRHDGRRRRRDRHASSPTSTASTRASTATGACAARSTRACSATTSTRRCAR